MDKEEQERYYNKRKQKIFGNVNFIGELFLERFLVPGVVRIVTSSLLCRFIKEFYEYKKAEPKPINRNYEDTLEGLLKLYEIIGKVVEEREIAEASKKGKDKKPKVSNIVANFQKAIKAINANSYTEALSQFNDDETSLDGLFKM